MADAVVEARSVTRRFGDAVILRDVTFRVPRGGLVAVTGRSGGGKSTLLKLLAGLDRPTSGEVLIEGRDISSLDDDAMSDVRLRRIGLVLQAANLLPDLTVIENVRLPLALAGRPRGEGLERATELLRLVGMESHAAKRPSVLSGGEMQRTAIARALANDPAVILADEPTGSLDADNARIVLDLIEDLHRRLGTTVVVATHDPLVVERVHARLSLDGGAVRWASPPPEPVPGPA